MTSVDSIRRRATDLVRQGGPARLLTAAAALLVVLGVVAALQDRTDLAAVAILLVQAVLLALHLLGRRQTAASEAAIVRRIDDSDTRVLTDLSRARHALLAALDERDGDR